MGGHHQGQPLLMELGQGDFQQIRMAGVQGGRGLVKENDLGFHGQNIGNGDPLFLAAGQVLGRLVQIAGDVHGGGGVLHGPCHLVLGQSQIHGAKGDFTADRRAQQLLLRVLKHQTHGLPQLPQGLALVDHGLTV